MFKIIISKSFNKDVKLCIRRGCQMDKLWTVIEILAEKGSLPSRYKAHKLSGNYAGLWECHIAPDWLLIWKQDHEALTLLMTRTGTHSDLF